MRKGADASLLRSTPTTSRARLASRARFKPSKPLAPVINNLISPSLPPPAPQLSFQPANCVKLLKRLDQPLDAFHIQPVVVCVARISKALRQWIALIGEAPLPERFRRLDDIHVRAFHGVARFIFGNQNLVELLPRPDANHRHGSAG